MALSLLYRLIPFLLAMTSYDVKWCRLTHHIGSAILDFMSKNNGNWYSWVLAKSLWKVVVAMAMPEMIDTQLTYQNFHRRWSWSNSYWKCQPLRVKTTSWGSSTPLTSPPPLYIFFLLLLLKKGLYKQETHARYRPGEKKKRKRSPLRHKNKV